MPRGRRRTQYVRDASGQFASTPGGGPSKSSPSAVRKAAKAAALKGGTLAARTSLKRSKAKLAASPSPQQKGAVTRGQKAARAAIKSSKTRLKTGSESKLRKGLATTLLTMAKSKPKAKPVEAKSTTKAKSTAKARPTTKTKKTTTKAQPTQKKVETRPKTSKKVKVKQVDKKPLARKENLAAQRAKRMAEKTGVIPGSKFESGQAVKTMSLKEMRSAVIKSVKGAGKLSMAAIAVGAGTGTGISRIESGRMPKTRSEWERAYRALVRLPMSDRGRKEKPGVINGIDIHKNFRPWAVFGLNPKTASKADVEQAYRRIAKKVHPDAGGRQKDFERIKSMRDSIVSMRNIGEQMKIDAKKSSPKTSSKAKKKSQSRARPSMLMLPPSRS